MTSDEDLRRLGDAVCNRILPKAEWTHHAHLGVAVYVLTMRDDLNAAADLPQIIRSYNEATGTPNTDTGGYHETITLASLAAVRSIVIARPELRPFEIANLVCASEYANKNWILRHWNQETLFSVAARRMWVAPDLGALPFPI